MSLWGGVLACRWGGTPRPTAGAGVRDARLGWAGSACARGGPTSSLLFCVLHCTRGTTPQRFHQCRHGLAERKKRRRASEMTWNVDLVVQLVSWTKLITFIEVEGLIWTLQKFEDQVDP